MKKTILALFLTVSLGARVITTDEVYSQAKLLQADVHYILDYYGIKYNSKNINNASYIDAKLKPRNVYQKTYELMIKANILRIEYGFVAIEPVNIAPQQHLDPNLVYEQIRRLLTEFRLFEIRSDMTQKLYKAHIYKGKKPIDVFNVLSAISVALDALNGSGFNPSYVFGENMRIYNDINLILNKLNIKDNTIPNKLNKKATPQDTFSTAMKTLDKIKQLQILSGIDIVDFTPFDKGVATPSEVFTMSQMILAELQTLKAYLGIKDATIPAYVYGIKTPTEVDQLMSWNLRKLNLIYNLRRGK